MTTKRQLAAVEKSLDPLGVVLRVIAEGQAYASIEACARSIAEQPVEVAPLTVIGKQIEASVRATMKGKSRDEINAAVEREVGDGVFRYILFIRINTAALEIAEHEGLRAAACSFWMGCLLGGPREADLEPAEWADHQNEQADAWRSWRGVVASLLALSLVEEDAREQLEARYLGGHPALFPETQTTWGGFADHVDRLWSLAEKIAPLTDDESERASGAGSAIYDERVADRARRIADDARVATFERLGEMPRAVSIMERRIQAMSL